MSHTHQSCFVVRAPRVPVRWRAILDVVVLLVEAFQDAEKMRRAAHEKYPFDNE